VLSLSLGIGPHVPNIQSERPDIRRRALRRQRRSTGLCVPARAEYGATTLPFQAVADTSFWRATGPALMHAGDSRSPDDDQAPSCEELISLTPVSVERVDLDELGV
jgi:hypothetical protein